MKSIQALGFSVLFIAGIADLETVISGVETNATVVVVIVGMALAVIGGLNEK